MSWVAAAIAGSAIIGGVVSSNNASKAADAMKAAAGQQPDLTGAYLQGIQTDMATLPTRLQVSQAATSGGVYTDPQSGQVYDFRGMFDPVKFFKENPDAYNYYLEEARATGNPVRSDVEGFAKDWFGGQGIQGPAQTEKLKSYMTGSAEYKRATDAEATRAAVTTGQNLAIDTAKTQLGALAGTDDYAAYVRANPDLLAEFEKNGGGMAIEDWGKRHFDTYGKAEGRKLPNSGLLTATNDLNLRTQGDTFNASLAASKQANATHLSNQADAYAATLKANELGFNANLAQSGTAARTATGLQEELVPRLNAVVLKNQNDAFRQNLTQSDEAAARSVAQQRTTLPALNDLGIQLQTASYKGADAAGRAVNPGLYSVRDTYAKQLEEELAAGANLTPTQQRKVQQQIRGSQAARGNILGDGAAFDEAIAASDYAQNLVNQRRTAALGLLNSRDLAPNFSSVGVVNPTQVVTPNSRAFDAITNPVQTVGVNNGPANFSSTAALSPNFAATTTSVPSLNPITATASDPLALLNANAGPNAANTAAGVWTTNTNNAAAAGTAAANQPNPWMQGIGLGLQAYSAFNRPGASGMTFPSSGVGSGVTTSIGTGAPITCWVARAVLGTESKQWRLFRAWLLLDAPARFRARYIRDGARFADSLANKPGLIALLRPFFLARATQMEALA